MSPACIAIPPLKKRTQNPQKQHGGKTSVFVEGKSNTLILSLIDGVGNFFLFIHPHTHPHNHLHNFFRL